MTAPRRFDSDLKIMVNSDGTIPPLPKSVDMVNHPPHYDFGPYETIDVIEAWGLPYHLGNVVKYVSRAKRKGKELEDLKKAAWYLNRYIEMIEKNNLYNRLEDLEKSYRHTEISKMDDIEGVSPV